MYATTWMNPENITISEISQTQKGKYCMILLTWGTKNSQIHRERKKNDCQGLRGENRKLLFNGYRISILDDWEVLEMDGSDVAR